MGTDKDRADPEEGQEPKDFEGWMAYHGLPLPSDVLTMRLAVLNWQALTRRQEDD